MESLFVLLVIFLVAVLFIFPIWALIKILSSARKIEELQARVDSLETVAEKGMASPASSSQVTQSQAMTMAPLSPPAVAFTPSAPKVVTPPPTVIAEVAPPPVVEVPKPPVVEPPPLVEPTAAVPPPLAKNTFDEFASVSVASEPPKAEPLVKPAVITPPPVIAPKRTKAPINWEQFMGVKLIAWLGGFAAFLGVAYGVKYSFEHDLIPPEVRAAGGFLLAIGMLAGGVLLSRKRYAVTAQTLCATGVVSLYAVTFACRAIYKFPFFGPMPTFALMALVTTTAFFLAIRMDARVVAILGILGGFLTPILISTGQDNPLGLFAYLSLLNAGLIAVALNRRWHFLVPLGALCTAIMQLGWASKFLVEEKTTTAMLICLTMNALFLAAYLVARRRKQADFAFSGSVAGIVLVSFGFAAYLGLATGAGLEPAKWLAFLFLADACLLTLSWLDERCAKWHLAGGALVFGLLAAWTMDRLGLGLLPWALGAYFVFAVLHAAFPLVLQKRHDGIDQGWWPQLFPPLALLLVIGPVLNSEEVSMLVWPAVLMIDLLAIILAWVMASVAGVAAVLILTLMAAGLWIFKIPVELTGLTSLLMVIGAFAVLFFAAGLWLARKFKQGASAISDKLGDQRKLQAQLPAMSALLPFVLLVMVATRLSLTDPTPIFGLTLVLIALTLGLARMLVLEWVAACALVGTAAVVYIWHGRQFTSATSPLTVIAWELGFVVIFTGFPFVFKNTFRTLRGPWIASALSGVLLFSPIYWQLKYHKLWPEDIAGVLPLFFALPPLVGLLAVLRGESADNPRRLGRLALFGGAALFFITLIFPIQFSRQWITIGWALEGAALLWLFHRVPHRGLPIVGVCLLAVSFVRLANPAVLRYHETGGAPILNWFLYTYGVAAACMLVGARLLAPPRERVLGLKWPPVLNALGIILLFLLLNIEIADYFAAPGEYALTFEFSGNFARDLSYTVGWSLFAFGLLVVGIWKKNAGARYTALALLGVTLLKLFFHDLANLGPLYRIGALFAVAVIAITASFVYQRFLPADEKPAEPKA